MAGVKLNPGDPITKLSAREWNRHCDVADWWERTQRLGEGGTASRLLSPRLMPDVVKVKNSSGADFRAGDVVELNASALTGCIADGFLWFECTETARSTDDNYWGIALEPLANGTIGLVRVVGVCMAYVDVSDTTHVRADAAIGDSTMTSGADGRVELLTQPTGTGEASYPVRLTWSRPPMIPFFRISDSPGTYITKPTVAFPDLHIEVSLGAGVGENYGGCFEDDGTDISCIVPGWYRMSVNVDITPDAGTGAGTNRQQFSVGVIGPHSNDNEAFYFLSTDDAAQSGTVLAQSGGWSSIVYLDDGDTPKLYIKRTAYYGLDLSGTLDAYAVSFNRLWIG